jgi:3-oxoacyl-[acyl-carrier-protein] synthase-3
MAFSGNKGFGARITGIGSHVPERILTNVDLERMVDTSDEWIVTRTGIRERRIAAEDAFTSHLAIAAVQDMAARWDVRLDDVDLIVACTHTPDFPFPGVSCLVQRHFRIEKTGAVDLNATCAGFVYGLIAAAGLIRAGIHRKVLVIGADTMSKITDYTDRTTCILFGDGAGAVMVERAEDAEVDFLLAADCGADGAGGHLAHRAGLAKSLDGIAFNPHGYFSQNGPEVYRWAVRTVPAGMKRLLLAAGLRAEDIDWFAPHNANLRMIEAICRQSGFPMERTLVGIDRYGNTSAASIPLSLDLGVRDGRVRQGDRLLLFGFGAGLVYAGAVIRWTL